MATVPGTPMQDTTGGIPPDLQPGPMHFMMAAAIMHSQGRMQLAGDVVPFTKKPLNLTGDQRQLEDYKKMMTRDTLSRALGGTTNVLPMQPKSEDKE